MYAFLSSPVSVCEQRDVGVGLGGAFGDFFFSFLLGLGGYVITYLSN